MRQGLLTSRGGSDRVLGSLFNTDPWREVSEEGGTSWKNQGIWTMAQGERIIEELQ
jgi:hypothetical protein